MECSEVVDLSFFTTAGLNFLFGENSVTVSINLLDILPGLAFEFPGDIF